MSRNCTVVSGLMLLTLALLLIAPYSGIRHDSVLYLGQASLPYLTPQISSDLFFSSGSQAAFTIFPQLIGKLLTIFPAGNVFLLGTLGGRLIFASASWVLLAQLFSRKIAYAALVALLILPSTYGRNGILAFGEIFFTGRTLAEPLILLALAAMLSGRWIWMAALWLLACSIHPLQALPAAILIWIWLCQCSKLFFLAPLIAIPVSLIFPSALWSAQYDADWFSAVALFNPMVLFTEWSVEDVFRVLTDVFFLSLVWKSADGKLKRFAGALLIAAVFAFSAHALFVEWLKMVLPTGLQLWRMHWILHWSAVASLPWLMRRHWKRRATEWAQLILLALIVLLEIPVQGSVFSLYGVLSLFALLYSAWPWMRSCLSFSTQKLLLAAVLVLTVCLYLALVIAVQDLECINGNCLSFDRAFFAHPLTLLCSVSFGILVWFKATDVGRGAVVIVLLAICSLGAATWDRRDDRARIIENTQPGVAQTNSPFGVALEKNAQVLWPNNLLATWLVLQRPAYMDDQQLGGLLFNRGTFEEASYRMNLLQSIDSKRQQCSLIYTRQSPIINACDFDEKFAARLCADAKSNLRYVVFAGGPSERAVGKWSLPLTMTKKSAGLQTYFLYSCNEFSATRPPIAGDLSSGA